MSSDGMYMYIFLLKSLTSIILALFYTTFRVWHTGGHPSVPKDSEIPATSTDAKGGKSKGVNLFLARQKMIADMMEAEEEAAKAAEGELNLLHAIGFRPTSQKF